MDAQQSTYSIALKEIISGRKQSHWMWYIFPQLLGLGSTEISKLYAIADVKEAEAFMAHPILGNRLVQISKELLKLDTTDAHQILGSPDDRKLRSSMTLFASTSNTNPAFEMVLQKFYKGLKDKKTMQILGFDQVDE